jgi:hypothetical protein
MVIEWVDDWFVGDESLDRSPLAFPLTLPLTSGFTSLSLESIGADALVGVVISIGSPGDGADIWIWGVGIGTILVMGSSGPSDTNGFLCRLSVMAAICAENAWLAVARRSITLNGIWAVNASAAAVESSFDNGTGDWSKRGPSPIHALFNLSTTCKKGGEHGLPHFFSSLLSLSKVQASKRGY